MSSSKHVQIRACAAALIAAIESPPDGGVLQNRDFALATGVTSQIHVNFRGTDPLADDPVFTGAPRDWATDLELVIIARKDGSVEASDVADALWVDAYAAVMADQTLGGLAWEIDPGRVDVEDGEADTSLCRLTCLLKVKHRTANNVLT
jgi:hypothetical protein